MNIVIGKQLNLLAVVVLMSRLEEILLHIDFVKQQHTVNMHTTVIMNYRYTI